MRASGLAPSARALSALITTSAAAPSLIEEALAAVTVPPSGWKAGLSFPIESAVVSPRTLSSVVKRERLALLLRDLDRELLGLEAARGGRLAGLLVRVGGELVLLAAR